MYISCHYLQNNNFGVKSLKLFQFYAFFLQTFEFCMPAAAKIQLKINNGRTIPSLEEVGLSFPFLWLCLTNLQFRFFNQPKNLQKVSTIVFTHFINLTIYRGQIACCQLPFFQVLLLLCLLFQWQFADLLRLFF